MKKIIVCLFVLVSIVLGSVVGSSAQLAPPPGDEPKKFVTDNFEASTFITNEQEKIESLQITNYIGPKDAKEIAIPHTIEGYPVVALNGLGQGLFEGMNKLEKVVLPCYLECFGESTFKNCYSLRTIEGFKNDVQYYGFTFKDVFLNTPWYEEMLAKSTNGVVMIGTTVYDLTKSKDDVVIPEGATYLPDSALVKYDEYGALGEPAKKLGFTSVTLPATMKDISEYVWELSKLKAINVAEGNKDFYSKDGVLYSDRTLVSYPRQKEGEELVVPFGVSKIDRVNSKFLKKVIFESSVEILPGAFNNCTKLSKIKFADGVEFSEPSFVGTKLKTVKLPKYANVDMGYGFKSVFHGCETLEKITVDKENTKLMVYDGSLYLYQAEFDMYTLIDYPANRKDDELVVLDKTTYIWSLDGAVHIKSLVLPKSIHRVYVKSAQSTFNNLKTIKYLGSKEEWREIRSNIGVCMHSGKIDISDIKVKYNAKSITSGEIVGVNARYKFKNKRVKPKIKVELDGQILNKKYYKVKYENNNKPGKANIVVSGKGSYYGQLTKTIKIRK